MFLMVHTLDVNNRGTPPLNEISKSIMKNNALVISNTDLSLRRSITIDPKETMRKDKINVEHDVLFGKIVNTHPYKYISKPSAVCNFTVNNVHPNLLILVKSDVFHIGHRMAIRATWGNLTNSARHIAFLLGYSSLVESFIKMEFNVYNDLIQEDFIDQYRNNTLKTIMGFKWAASNCRHAKFVLFVDDDYFVNMPNLINLIEDIEKSEQQSVFIGRMQKFRYVHRNKYNKWYVSTDEYPNKKWPPFISGGSMLLSMDVVIKFALAFPYVKSISLDDVYLGMVAKILKITMTHNERFETRFIIKKLKKLITSHDYGSPTILVSEFNRLFQRGKY
ncbi:beta-1,3-galactosyltransferase brn-like [Mytilus trossulus]|uniref:beta-1,3-galactosyltransferase brn-like n=1 Tax=Mytilus trossulus TaxID=6551 RepID=UPI003007B49F